MIFSVVETHRNGVRLTRQEVQEAIACVGTLVVEDWREGNYARRALRVARLMTDKLNQRPQLLLPLFDPVLVRMTDSGFLLLGYQIESGPGREVAEHVQGWWVRQSH